MNKEPSMMLFFYQDNKLVTVKEGAHHRAILRNAEQPLAELSTDDTKAGGPLATDQMGSVLAVQGSANHP
ncbi:MULTISPECIES: hypothetical protein [Pseudomonas]|uniref:Uncharacterized protein n=1 Tax=Pseudomonas juntendi TaxID=2666183 RepID=A0A7W2LQ78_9PSED|nr:MULTISPECIES: hypothetical protein [Pseudomonas]NOY04318.1 hypothetical protein [Gammaproteobacteria bacterium]OAK57956.1 hypothetical protein A3K88_22420 [Pseudomonas putida]PPB14792.1 hypothetical protein HV87_08700 [Pseudomonas aeruginosa]MBA6145025.1 hypothetical protein [Pseudomonas juntendi]MCL8331116.1 hypothetical protein [Pseudomonas juntendi]